MKNYTLLDLKNPIYNGFGEGGKTCCSYGIQPQRVSPASSTNRSLLGSYACKHTMKRFLLILLVIFVFSIGCDSDSNIDSRTYQTAPVGPTQTFNVPGAYSSIQEAINAAGSSDFIRVAAGVYSENIQIRSKNFSLRGAGTGQTILQGAITIENSSEASIEGFTVKGGGIHAKRSSVRISGNEIIDNPGPGVWLESCFNVMVSGNTIKNNSDEGIVFDDSNGIIGSNAITYNATDGVVINNCSPTLINNTVAFNGRDGISIRGFIFQSAPLLLGNAIYENGNQSNYDIICFGETNPTGNENLFDRCINCAECRSFDDPPTYQD